MGIRTFKSKIEFESFLEEKLNYLTISIMSFDEYKSFVYDLFDRLNKLRNLGVDKDEIKDFVHKHFSNVMSAADDSDILFERRFASITEDIIEFCADPFFWETDYSVYLQKWDRAFKHDWFKKI